MLKSRLIQVLRTFNKKELREFKKWVQSPFHNQREDVIKLYDYLIESSNLLNDNLLDKSFVFPRIYPNEKFDDSKMRQVMHFLFKAMEEYLFYQEENTNEIKKKLSLLKIYRERKLDKSFLKIQKDIESYFLKAKNPNEDDFFNEYLLRKEGVKFNSKISRSQELNLQNFSDSYDKAFIAEKLKHACLIISHQRVFNIQYEIGLLDEVLNFIEKNNLLDSLRIGIQYYSYKILRENNVDDFYKLKSYLEKVENVPDIEVREAYIYSINFCISQMNTGNEVFVQEAFNLYKNGIEKKILIENNILSRWTFNNIVGIALRLKEYEWVKSFIENYNQYLEEKYRESFFHFNYAKLYYTKGDYNKTLDVIQKYEFKDVLINISAKTMLLKIYYELNEFLVLESLLESMRAYIQRKKEVGNKRKSNYKNIIRYTKKLLKVNPYSKAQKEKLKVEIEAAKPLTEKAWLLKQLAEL